MNEDRWNKIELLIEQALDLPPEEQNAFLQKECGADEELKKEITSLLQYKHQAFSFIQDFSENIVQPSFTNMSEGMSHQDNRLNSVIGHYQITDKLGEGGMGVVYKAHDTKLDRTVALKFLPSRFTESTENKERFIHEAKTAATLNHSNICTIYSIDEYDGQQFISMEYVEGTTLREKLYSDQLKLSSVLRYSKQIVDALSSAHAKGIVHRDIKPENIMVDEHDHIKVMDFGLARVKGTKNLTKEGQIVGTMPYMSPEQIQYGEADERSDLFSFGIVLYEMLTGVHPFKGEYEQATWFNLINKTPEPPSSIRPEIPPSIEDVVYRCLEKESDKRYQSARDLSLELEGESSWPFKIANGGTRNRKQKLWIWTAVGILILVLGGWMYSLTAGSQLPEEKHIAVLPFKNLSSEVIPASMSDGIMEVVTSKITRMETQHGSLWVVPSSEVRETGVSSTSEATQLFGVSMAVTGSLQRVGDQFQLTINLVDGNTLRNLRSEVIEREWNGTDFAQLQDDVVESLTRMLELELGSDAVKSILAGGSEDPRAYQLYIEGKGALSRFEDPQKIDAAIVLFEEAIEEDPSYALAHAGLAEAYWRKYELTRDTQWTEVAHSYANKAINLNSNLPEVRITLALINNGMGRYEETLDLLANLENEDGLSFDALIQKGKAYEGLGNMDAAENSYQMAIDQKKNFWGGFHNLGVFYYRNSQYQKAINAFLKVTELTPNNTRGYNNLGGIYGNIGQTEKAIESFKKSLSIDTTYRVLTNLGTLHLSENNYSDAIQYYSEAVKRRDTDYRVWGSLGYAYHYSDKNHTKVLETMKRAIDLAEQELKVNPNSTELLEDLAGYYLTLGNTDQTRILLQQLTLNDELTAQNQAIIGHLYERLGNRESALQWFERALQNGYPYSAISSLEEIESLLQDPRMDKFREKYQQ